MSGHQREKLPSATPEQGLAYYLAVSEAHEAAGYDMAKGQAPLYSVCVCSDSRQQVDVATGLVPSESAVFSPLGNVLKYSNPGAFITGPDGEVEEAAGKWLELSKHYGIDKVLLVQHSGCGQMNVLHSYHRAENGQNTIKEEFGKFFARDAERRLPLIARVEKNGFAHYEKMGIELIGTDAAKCQQAMAVEQLITDMKAVAALANSDPENYPQPMGMFQHIVAKRFFTFTLNEGNFQEIMPATPTKKLLTCCSHNTCHCTR